MTLQDQLKEKTAFFFLLIVKVNMSGNDRKRQVFPAKPMLPGRQEFEGGLP
jgi:hypothetical protein